MNTSDNDTEEDRRLTELAPPCIADGTISVDTGTHLLKLSCEPRVGLCYLPKLTQRCSCFIRTTFKREKKKKRGLGQDEE